MPLHLVLDIGNSRVKGAFFKDGTLLDTFALSSAEDFQSYIKGKEINRTLISSVHPETKKKIVSILESEKIPYLQLAKENLALSFDVDEKENVGEDRIANCYGALSHFPQNDCIVIDIGTAVTFDYVTKDGKYLGGAIYPGFAISAKGLSDYTQLLPEVHIEKPEGAVAKTTMTHIQSGIYWGLLGAIERLVFEMKSINPSPSSVQVVATGGCTQKERTPTNFLDDLGELVDCIDPQLTLVGLHEILKEHIKKEK